MAKGDLHIHTSVSDGMLTPCELARAALQSGLDFLSVTDHNSLGALEEVGGALAGGRIRFIPGVELSAQPRDGDEIHILGYGFGGELGPLEELCREVRRRKRDQLREIAFRLHRYGVDVDAEQAIEAHEGGAVGRPVLAELLVRDGIVETLGQAFRRYLGRDSPAFVPMGYVSPRRCIEAIHRAGGLAVLAHPSIDTIDRWIQPLAALGLDGVEAYRPSLTGNDQLYVEKAAEHFGLFVTGGSDWHGRRSEAPLGAFWISEDETREFFRALDQRWD